MTTEEMLEVLRDAGNLKICASHQEPKGFYVSTDTQGVCSWAHLFGHAVSKAYQRYLNQGDTCASAAK